jgi:erythromycin esterase-like protein
MTEQPERLESVLCPDLLVRRFVAGELGTAGRSAPRKVARLLVFLKLLDRFSVEPAVLTALTELRQCVTLAGLGAQIERLLARDLVDDAVRLALDTTAMLTQTAMRAGQLNPRMSDLDAYVNCAREDLLEVATTVRSATTAPDVREPTDVSHVRSASWPTTNGMPADEVLFDLVGDARFVLIGEASHGTHEFYAARARMTQRLIEEKGFCAVASEADWPDAYRVNRYIRGQSEDTTAEQALRGFDRFPTWMWRNADVVDFVGWLRDHNDGARDERDRAGFYGLDLYSMHKSAHEVISYLATVDPDAAARARERYSCFDHVDDEQGCHVAAAFGAGETCERQVVEQLVELQQYAFDRALRDGLIASDEQFYAEQNARLVLGAERYYRSMFGSREASWNLRDRHMAETLDELAEHLGRRRGKPAKIVVWAHNSHLGDARATEMSARGELNVGQLVRERHPGDCRLIGFTTYCGTVTAATDWGALADRKQVRPGLAGSIEELFHRTGQREFMLNLAHGRAADVLEPARLERAIGVIYRPQTERQSHYFRTSAANQFDAMIHIDQTRAVEPLERTARWDTGDLPDTFPHAV